MKDNVNNTNSMEGDEPMADINSEAFKYWIHCNKCFYFFYQKTISLYLLSCNHLLCEKCLGKPPSSDQNCVYKCVICSGTARARMIGNDMPTHLKQLFHPTPWLSDLPTARIIKFQTKHRQHLMKTLETFERKCIRKEELVRETQKILQQKDKELRLRKHENNKLERLVRPILTAYKHKKRSKALQKQSIKNCNLENDFGKTLTKRALPNKIDFNRSHYDAINIDQLLLQFKPPVSSFAGSIPQGAFHL